MEFILQNKQTKTQKVTKKKYCLLIGNSRWHWAIQEDKKWSFFHTYPNPKKLKSISKSLSKWAAVGPIPDEIELDHSRCIKINNIPLKKLPKWIGIDRALVAWAAFEKAKFKNLHQKGVLIADAGTIISLTCISSKGEFIGGQLAAGLKLQRSIMSNGAEKLNPIQSDKIPKSKFPKHTEEAMLRGSFHALIGLLIEAKKETQMPMWLCGGDSEILFKHLKDRINDIHFCPDLILEGIAKINLKTKQDLNQTKFDLPC